MRLMSVAVFLSVIFSVWGQSSKEEVLSDLNQTGGVYFAYPVTESINTPPPDGYLPVYISHYGRHGSRYLISDDDYVWVRDLMHRAFESKALTLLGKDVLFRLDSLLIETRGRGGDLSPLGVRQQRGIADRMADSYSEMFVGDTEVSARSTMVPRCILSMDAFCERLKEINPELRITREASARYMYYMCYHSPESGEYTSGIWKERYRKFEESHTHPRRMMETLFTDPAFVEKYVNPHKLMWGFYWIASGMQDVETKLSFYDLFTADELFSLWQCFNYRFYACDGSFADNGGLPVANAANLLRNIIDSADSALASGHKAVTLRFGHDGNLIPLAALMQIEGCHESVDEPEMFHHVFSDYKIAPMAGNIQLIFFRHFKTGDVLVKIMLNEREKKIPVSTERFPFYNWDRVKSYYEAVCEDAAAKVTLSREK